MIGLDELKAVRGGFNKSNSSLFQSDGSLLTFGLGGTKPDEAGGGVQLLDVIRISYFMDFFFNFESLTIFPPFLVE